jgi:hypothetical protein
MISRSDTINISNMPVASEHDLASADPSQYKDALSMFADANAAKGWKQTTFQATPLVRNTTPSASSKRTHAVIIMLKWLLCFPDVHLSGRFCERTFFSP